MICQPALWLKVILRLNTRSRYHFGFEEVLLSFFALHTLTPACHAPAAASQVWLWNVRLLELNGFAQCLVEDSFWVKLCFNERTHKQYNYFLSPAGTASKHWSWLVADGYAAWSIIMLSFGIVVFKHVFFPWPVGQCGSTSGSFFKRAISWAIACQGFGGIVCCWSWLFAMIWYAAEWSWLAGLSLVKLRPGDLVVPSLGLGALLCQIGGIVFQISCCGFPKLNCFTLGKLLGVISSMV